MQHFQHIMLCYFKKGKTATETQKRFMQYVDSLDDAPQSGRPVEVDIDQIETLIENNQHYTTHKIADINYLNQSYW